MNIDDDQEPNQSLASITHQLALLFRTLSSQHSSEVTTTVRAIDRTLAQAGIDLHDFGELVAVTLSGASVYAPPPDESVPADVARWCLARGHDQFNPKQLGFLANMTYNQCWDYITPKQRKFLVGLYARLRGEAMV